MRISRPTGSSSPNRFSATVAPAGSPPCARRPLPRRRRGGRSATPSHARRRNPDRRRCTGADQFWLPATTAASGGWSRPRPRPPGCRARSRAASSQVRFDRPPAPSRTPPMVADPPQHDQQVGAERLDLRQHLLARARAHRHRRDHRRDADEDAERGQHRAQLVRGERGRARRAAPRPGPCRPRAGGQRRQHARGRRARRRRRPRDGTGAFTPPASIGGSAASSAAASAGVLARVRHQPAVAEAQHARRRSARPRHRA